jgi:hypothetical protein
MEKPKSLTPKRAFALLPEMRINEEWQRKKDAGELPEGMAGIFGCMDTIWPEEKLTKEEAEYILWLSEQMSMRCVAAEIFDNGNQIFGSDIIEAAKRVIHTKEKENDA